MIIGAIKPVTLAVNSSPAKDPPWAPEDLNKLKLLMNEGIADDEIARQLGATITDVAQQVATLSASAYTSNLTSGSQGEGPPPVGNNLDVKA